LEIIFGGIRFQYSKLRLSTCRSLSRALSTILISNESTQTQGTSYIVPVKRENEKNLSFIKTASYKTLLILGTLFPLNPMTDLPLTRRISRP